MESSHEIFDAFDPSGMLNGTAKPLFDCQVGRMLDWLLGARRAVTEAQAEVHAFQ